MKSKLSSIKSFLKFIIKKYPSLSLSVNYDDYWDEKRANGFGKISEFQRRRLTVVASFLKYNKTLKDIGCGEGSFLLELMKKVSFKKVYGVDLSANALDFIKNKNIEVLEAQIMNHDVRKCLPNSDYSILLELLEHTTEPEQILLDTISTTNEKVIFSVPNTGYLAHRLRLLFGSFPLQWRRNPSEHLRFWTVRDMKWWLTELKLIKYSEIRLYEGIPLLNKLAPPIFGAGIVVCVDILKLNSDKN